MTFESYAFSHVGSVRKRNEDAFLCAPGFAVVADGVGGCPGGAEAATKIVEALTPLASAWPVPEGDALPHDVMAWALLGALERAHEAVSAQGRTAKWALMSSTVVAVAVVGDVLVVVHAGDSRAYVCRHGVHRNRTGTLYRITDDHTSTWIEDGVEKRGLDKGVGIGAQLNAEIEHQTACDSTIGPDAPLGTRGAVMADTVGAAKA